MGSAEDWRRVGAAIEARMKELSLTRAELVRASGVSGKSIDGYIHGNPIKRMDKKRDLSRALHWSPDSIDLLLAGEEPVWRPTAPDPNALHDGHGGSEGWPPWLEEKFVRLEMRVDRLEEVAGRPLGSSPASSRVTTRSRRAMTQSTRPSIAVMRRSADKAPASSRFSIPAPPPGAPVRLLISLDDVEVIPSADSGSTPERLFICERAFWPSHGGSTTPTVDGACDVRSRLQDRLPVEVSISQVNKLACPQTPWSVPVTVQDDTPSPCLKHTLNPQVSGSNPEGRTRSVVESGCDGSHRTTGKLQNPVKGSWRLRPSGAYELRVYAGKDPVTGKERTVTKTFRGGTRQRDAELREFIKEVEEGRRGGTKASLRWLLDRWVTQIRRQGHSPTTLREYERIITKTINPALGSRSLRKLTAKDLDDLYGSLTDRGLAPATVRQVHSILRAALAQGVKWGYLPVNPAASASPPKLRKKEADAPTPAEVQRIIAHAEKDDPELACLIALAALTGARRGELCGLRWGDVDWRAKTITIERSVAVMGRGNLVIKGTKTHAARRVALDTLTMAVLRRHRKRVEMLADDKDLELADDSPLISYDLERPIAPDTASHYVRAAATAVGVDTHLHSLRHFTATNLIADGHDVRTVAGRLGHADASMTLRVYSHAMPEKDRDAAASLGRALTPKKRSRKELPK